MRFALPILLLTPLASRSSAQEFSLQLGDRWGPSVSIGWGRPTPRIRPLQRPMHRCSSACVRTIRERTWQHGASRWIEEPATYRWVRTHCGWQRICVRPATRRCIQEPGRWVWTTRAVRRCS